MAEDAPGVQNKGMLLVSLAVAAVVVIIYNWQIHRVRTESRGKTIFVARFEKDMKPDEKLDVDKDLSVQEMSEMMESGLGNIVVLKTRDDIRRFNGFTMFEKAQKNQFLQLNQIGMQREAVPSRVINPSMVAVTVPLDSADAPGDILRVWDRVNLIGKLSVGNGPLTSYRIIEGVKVLSIGGKAYREPSPGAKIRTDEGMTSYRSIVIEVSPEVSLQLNNIISHLQGGAEVEVLNPESKLPPGAGTIKPPLDKLPAATRRGSMGPMGGGPE